jgi:c(7)-type cytochrome triheme protein
MRFLISIPVMVLAALWFCFAPPLIGAGSGPPAIRYRGGAQGRVIFDHQSHASKGASCNDCHTDYKGTGKQLFATRKKGLISFSDHASGTRCFACHEGKKTETQVGECNQCHRKATGS